MKTAVLLVNLGTPANTSKKAIKSYLREFLSDHRVINLPRLMRFVLVNALIVPFRSSKTQHAYQSIWTSAGSPLLINSRNLQQKLRLQLNPYTPETKQEAFEVFLAMSYGHPNIADVLAELQHNNFTRIIIVPLYPQYASASTGSALEKCLKHLSEFRYFPKIICLNEFFSSTGYINALANSLKPYISAQANPNSHILFSYHGIPKQQLAVTKQTKPLCDDEQSCLKCDYSVTCYRAQCYVTSKLVADQLSLPSENYTTAFQSRLGKLPWVRPYTDQVIKKLREQNIAHLTVVCPSFVVDCLETLEEIGMRLKDEWLKLGGSTFTLVPCLNDNDDWVANLAELIKQ